ncbi:MAG: toll/interleukin-1 receptor domain-containing protein, partial [Saprospiraceae bacterium]|nr:toll/interleukin-1 receptor domain-containing protein [Saprospiraceae bacterium]
MSNPTVFISHAAQDDTFVTDLRQNLESHGASVWDDSRKLIGGVVLQDEILQAINRHDYFIIVVSPHTFQSKWVKDELEFAKFMPGKRIIALLLDGQAVGALAWMFDQQPLAISISTTPGGLQQAMAQILAALGLRLPDAAEPTVQPPEPPVNDLLLVLENPTLYTEGGLRRGQARAYLEMHPADGSDAWRTPAFDFVCPLGPIEAGRMKWYIEEYPQTTFLEKILDRGAELEREMAGWGQQLFEAITNAPEARELFFEWKGEQVHERRFSVKFNFFNEKNLPADQQEAIN